MKVHKIVPYPPFAWLDSTACRTYAADTVQTTNEWSEVTCQRCLQVERNEIALRCARAVLAFPGVA